MAIGAPNSSDIPTENPTGRRAWDKISPKDEASDDSERAISEVRAKVVSWLRTPLNGILSAEDLEP